MLPVCMPDCEVADSVGTLSWQLLGYISVAQHSGSCSLIGGMREQNGEKKESSPPIFPPEWREEKEGSRERVLLGTLVEITHNLAIMQTCNP